jgi:hypothetical protein
MPPAIERRGRPRARNPHFLGATRNPDLATKKLPQKIAQIASKNAIHTTKKD